MPLATLIKMLQDYGLADKDGNPTPLAYEKGYAVYADPKLLN